MQSLELIVARARNGVIGANGTIPWHVPEDLRHFREVTMGCPVIMGRRTWESIGRPLPGRRNIVLTRRTNLPAAGAECASSLESALALVADAPRVVVIGGASLYRSALPLADRAWVTEVDAAPEGDTFFYDLDPEQWQGELLCSLKEKAGIPAVKFFLYTRRHCRPA